MLPTTKRGGDSYPRRMVGFQGDVQGQGFIWAPRFSRVAASTAILGMGKLEQLYNPNPSGCKWGDSRSGCSTSSPQQRRETEYEGYNLETSSY